MVRNEVIKICLICDKEFYISGCKKHKDIYCSKKCFYKYRDVRREKCQRGEQLLCTQHGLHSNWYYNKSNGNTVCVPCRNKESRELRKKQERKIPELLNGARYRAKKFKMEFDIDKEFLEKLRIKQNNRCSISGIEFIDNDKNLSISLDRIDSNGGYTRDNVQLVTRIVNFMKMDHSQKLFIDICNIISKYNKMENLHGKLAGRHVMYRPNLFY